MIRDVRLVGWVLVLITALMMSSCGGSDGDRTPTQPELAKPTPTANSEAARTHLDALLELMEAYSINKKTSDWTTFRKDVFTAAGVAQTIPDLYPAIAVALQRLDDYESYYASREGRPIGPSPVGACGAATPITPTLPDTVGHVKVQGCWPCQGDAETTQCAESIQRVIRAADRAGLIGWIVDLRGNSGGNMWPMIAGIGPILGEGIIGYIVYNDREYEREYHAGAATSFGEAFARVGVPYALLKEYPKVAVLTDGAVVSAGEAIAVWFRARPRTRSFGKSTCGHHHLLQEFPLPNGAILLLVTAQNADRMKVKYGGPIHPDEIIADPTEAVNRAIAWLQAGG